MASLDHCGITFRTDLYGTVCPLCGENLYSALSFGLDLRSGEEQEDAHVFMVAGRVPGEATYAIAEKMEVWTTTHGELTKEILDWNRLCYTNMGGIDPRKYTKGPELKKTYKVPPWRITSFRHTREEKILGPFIGWLRGAHKELAAAKKEATPWPRGQEGSPFSPQEAQIYRRLKTYPPYAWALLPGLRDVLPWSFHRIREFTAENPLYVVLRLLPPSVPILSASCPPELGEELFETPEPPLDYLRVYAGRDEIQYITLFSQLAGLSPGFAAPAESSK